MTILKSVISVILVPILISSPAKKTGNVSLEGVVIDKVTGKPLPGIYLYIVKGEEEALTNDRGAFTIVTWQKLPVVLHVRDPKKEYLRVKVANTSERILIKL